MDPFVHLHTHTEYSLFDGISRIPDLVAHVKAMGQTAIAITDHGSMYGAVYLYNECKKQGIKPIIGCEIYITQNSRFQVPPGREKLYHLILLAENNEGYHNLVKICSRAWTEGFHNKPRADHDLLRKYHKGLIALSACVGGELPQAILSGDMDKAHEVIKFYIDTFGRDNYFIELQNHRLPEEARVRPVLADLAKEYGLGLVATNDFHYVRKEDAASQEIKLCISTGKTLDDPEHFHFANDEFYCKSGEEMRSILGGYEGAIENTARIAERCNVTFTFGEHKLPAFDVPEGETAKTYLRKLCEKAIPERYGQKTPEVMNRLNYELGIIDRMGFSDYFLIVMDFIHFAKTHGIPIGPGRGSAAGSIVSYLLHITELDPLEFDLLFERFLNPERVSMPDIDTDLCYRGRGRVIDYLAHKYGEDHVAQIITFSTLAARAVIRDVGRVMNLPLRDVDKIAKMIPQGPGVTLEKTLESSPEFKSAYETNPTVHTLIDHCLKLEGLSRQAGTHAAGVVICSAPVDDFVPIQLTQENFIQTQYEKDQVEKLGLLKMDLLGLRNLTVIQDTVDMIKENRNIDLDVRKIPYKDKATSEMLCQGDTIGVFQSESSGYTNLLMQLAPDAFQDLIPMVALYRPGPLGSGMAEDFIKRKHGKIPVEYPHPMLEPVLKETYGVILLRRAMGHKESDVLLAQRQAFLEGAEKQGVSSEVANHVFDLMVHFAGYGFNKSHSVCYAWIAWQTAYLKAHFRPEFMAAMMTCYNGDRGKVSRYIANSRKHGVKLVAPNVNRSRASFAASGNTILFGLSGIQHLGDAAVESIIEAREKDGPFTSLSDFLERVDGRTVNARACESLIKCGALDDLGANRPQMLEALPQAMSNAAMVREDRQSGQISLFGQSEPVHEVAYKPLPDASAREKIDWERQLLGFYVSGHPLDRFKNEMKQCVPLSELEGEGRVTLDGKLITVGGIINHVKGMVTKKGAPMGYITLEDFTGEIEVVVFPSAWEKYRELLRNDAAILLSGRVQANERTVHILAERIALLDDVKQRKEDQIAQRGHIRALHLYLDEWHESAEVSRQLAVILKRHHGQIPVFLHMERTRKKITMNEQFANDGSVASENALKLLLGNGAVEYDKEND